MGLERGVYSMSKVSILNTNNHLGVWSAFGSNTAIHHLENGMRLAVNSPLLAFLRSHLLFMQVFEL